MSDTTDGGVRLDPPVYVRVTPKKDDPATVDMARWAERLMNLDIRRQIMHLVKYGHLPHD